MTNSYDKYNGFNWLTLLKSVQDTSIKLIDPEYRKSITPTRMSRLVNDLRDMQGSLMLRLKQMDRNKKEFFPIGAHIEYRDPNLPMNWEPGQVVGYQEEMVTIWYEKKKIHIATWPQYLRLRFIRINY